MKMDEETAVRVLLYKFFSRAFHSPREHLLELLKPLLKDLRTIDYRKYTDVDPEKIVKILEESNHEKLSTEYVNLFINKYPKVPCPPHESYFRSGSLFDPIVLTDLERFYTKLNLKPKSNFGDQIANVLEYMFILNAIDKLNKEEKQKMETEFFEKHIYSWATKLVKCIKENTKEKYYLKLAEEFEKFLKEEKERLGI